MDLVKINGKHKTYVVFLLSIRQFRRREKIDSRDRLRLRTGTADGTR